MLEKVHIAGRFPGENVALHRQYLFSPVDSRKGCECGARAQGSHDGALLSSA